MMRLLVLGVRIEEEGGLESWRPDVVDGLEQLGISYEVIPISTATEEDIMSREFDGLIWIKDKSEVGSAIERLKDKGIPTIGIHTDLYWGLRRQSQIGQTPWWNCGWVWTSDGGQRNWPANVNHHYFSPPFGTRYLGLVEPDPVFNYQAAFVGRVITRIHGEHRTRLLNWAKHQFGTGFVHYGPRNRKLWHQDLNRLYASVGVVLGDSAYAPYYWSDRVPRTLGRGGLFAHPRVEGMEAEGYTDEVMILYDRFEFDQITERLASLSEQDRRQMREAAVDLVRDRHLWRHRLERMLKVAGLW